MTGKRVVKSLLLLIIPAAAYYICKSYGLRQDYAIYAAITSWAVYCWASLMLSSAMVGVALPVMYLLSGIAGVNVVFAPWGNMLPWFCLSGMLIGHMLLKTGLANRVAYKCILISGDRFYNVLFGIMIAGFLVSPLIPTALGKMAIFCALGLGIANAMQLDPLSKESSALMLTCLFAVAPPSYCFLTSCVQVPASVQLMTQASGIKVTWFEYAWHNFLPAVIYSFLCFGAMLAVLRPDNHGGGRATIAEKYQALGKMGRDEKKAMVILAITLLFLVTDSWHQISLAWGMVLITLLMFLPGVDLLENSDFEKVNLAMLFFIAGAMSIGSVAVHIDIAKQLAENIAGLFQFGEKVFYLWLSYFSGIIMLFFLTPTTSLIALSVPLTEVALKLGIDPRAMLYSFIFGMDQYIFPYQYGVVLLLYSYERLGMRHLMLVLAGKAIVATAVFFPLILFYWKIIGLW